MTRLNRVLLSILLLLVASVPFAISSASGIIDPFTHGNVASGILLLKQGTIDFDTSTIRFTPADGTLIASVSLTTGLSPVFLEYLPIAGLFAIAAAFALARALSHGILASLLIVNVLTYRFYSPFLYSVWPHSLGYSLFLLFVAVFIRYVQSREPRYIVVLVLVFLGIHFFSYNAELWAIAFLLLFETGRFVVRRRTRNVVARMPPAAALLGAFLVMFLVFNQVIYGAYLPRFSSLEQEFTITFRYYLSTLFRGPSPVPYAWIPPPSPIVLTLAIVTWFAMASAIAVLAAMSYARRHFKLRKSGNSLVSSRALVIFALLGVWVIDVATYLPVGAARVATTRYLTLALPFVIGPAIVFLGHRNAERTSRIVRAKKSSDPKRTAAGCLSIMLVLSVTIFSLTVAGGHYVTSPSHFADVHGAADWLLNAAPSTTHITSDHNTQGQFAIVFAEAGVFFFSNNLYRPESFSQLINPNITASGRGYFASSFVVVNMALSDKPTTAGGWLDFQPISPYMDKIDGNPNLLRVYDDGRVLIYRGT